MAKQLVLLCIMVIIWSSSTLADRHVRVYLTTVLSKSLPGVPLYSRSRVLDDITLYWYDGYTRLLEVRAPWFKNTSANLLMINFNEIFNQMTMQKYLVTLSNKLNSSQDYDILQKKEGCMIYSNGTVQGFLSQAYNGKFFAHFDIEAAMWVTKLLEAQSFVDALNSNKTVNEDVKKDLMDTCVYSIGWLKSLKELRNGTLHKLEKPTVRVSGRSISSDMVTLSCKAYGHYPRNISLKWWRNGHQVAEEEIKRLILPFPDQTYLSLSSLNITPTADDMYTCEVTHSSLEETVRQHWKPFQPSLHSLSQDTGGLSFGIVIVLSLTAVLLLSGAAIGLVAVDKKSFLSIFHKPLDVSERNSSRSSARFSDTQDPPVFLITVKKFNPFDPSPDPPMNVISISNVYDTTSRIPGPAPKTDYSEYHQVQGSSRSNSVSKKDIDGPSRD